MKLSTYLSTNKITYDAFALQTGYTVFAVGKWARDQRQPRPSAMRKIALATGGQVTPNDFAGVAEGASTHITAAAG